MSKRLSPAERDARDARIIELSPTGMTNAQIADAVGTNRTTVQRVRSAAGYRRVLPAKERAARNREIVRLIRAGVPNVQIAAKVGATVNVVQKVRRAAGFSRQIGSHWTPPDERAVRNAEIVRLTNAGLFAPAIAKKLGCTIRTVQRVRKAAGISKPRPNAMTEAEIRFAEQLLDDGASYAEVARTLRRSECPIVRRFPGRSQWSRSSGVESRRLREALEAIPNHIPCARLLVAAK